MGWGDGGVGPGEWMAHRPCGLSLAPGLWWCDRFGPSLRVGSRGAGVLIGVSGGVL